MHAMEEKGRGWLVSRSSATSLFPRNAINGDHATLYEVSTAREDRDGEGSRRARMYTRSAPHSRFASRQHSRTGSRAGSRVDLITMARSYNSTSKLQPKQSFPSGFQGQGLVGMEPDFIDLDERDLEPRERDPMGVDEGEMRRLVMGRVGGWVDWMVGWMDFRGLEDEDGEGELEDENSDIDKGVNEGEGREEVLDDTTGIQDVIGVDDTVRLEGGVSTFPAPGAGGGVWDDARWLLRVAADSL